MKKLSIVLSILFFASVSYAEDSQTQETQDQRKIQKTETFTYVFDDAFLPQAQAAKVQEDDQEQRKKVLEELKANLARLSQITYIETNK